MLLAVWSAALVVGVAPEDTVAKIVAEYQAAVRALDSERRNPKTSQSKIASLTKRAQSDRFADRMLKAAKQDPASAAAFEAFQWILKSQGGPSTTAAQKEAAELLLANHLSEPKLPKLCTELAASRNAASEKLLRGALANAPSRETRGAACIALSSYLQCMATWAEYCQFSDQSQRRMMESTPEGKELLKWTSDVDASDLRQEAKSLSNRIAKEFADLKLRDNPAPKGPPTPGVGGPPVGKPAPEIVGEDLDGKRMKLSDFRGKVVVIEFWAWWCVYCRALVPPDEKLMSQMRNRPFALLGVNSDGDLAAAKKSAQEAGLAWPHWPSWKDGRAIAAKWGVVRWPTTCVLDHRGVVRHVGLTGKELEDAVEALMKEIPPAKSP